jgi:hypothetical protein
VHWLDGVYDTKREAQTALDAMLAERETKKGEKETPVIHRHTNISLMEKVFELLDEMPEYERISKILDYRLPAHSDAVTLNNYEFDFIAYPNFGGSEGIYVNCFIVGQFTDGSRFDDGKTHRLSMGTFKTLETSLESMKLMGELSGLFVYVASHYVNNNLELFERKQEVQASKSKGMSL